MEYIICIAGICGSGLNMFLLAWAGRARGFAALCTICIMILHYESLLRLMAGYHIVVDLATRNVVYALINSVFLLYWAGAVMEYLWFVQRIKAEMRRKARLRSLLGRQNDS